MLMIHLIFILRSNQGKSKFILFAKKNYAKIEKNRCSTQQEIPIGKGNVMDQNKLFLASLEDKYNQCRERYMITHTSFLDLSQQSAAAGLFRRLLGKPGSAPGERPFWPAKEQTGVFFYGGCLESERCLCLFLPDYIPVQTQEALDTFFEENPEENPLVLLRISQKGDRTLSHRDYLGSLMGLGIRRETIGDIAVREDGADILILKELSDYLLSQYDKAGRVSLKTELLSVQQLRPAPVKTKLIRDTVASLRLDSIVASAFQISRTKAAEAIRTGLVFVDSLQTDKHDRQVSEGSRLVLRGKGKAVLKKIEGSTKKDRIFITIEKYI